MRSRELQSFASIVHRRRLDTTILLMLASHRPLIFITGQLLYAVAPLGALLGWEGLDEWAARLSAPDANQRLLAIVLAPHQPHPRQGAGEPTPHRQA